MTIYVGRWILLPGNWEGINGLYEKSEDEIRDEINRQKEIDLEGRTIGIYTPAEFEETFNGDNMDELYGSKYFIKFFENGKSVLTK